MRTWADPKIIIAIVIGLVLGGIDGWFKGFFGITGPIASVIAAVVCAWLAAMVLTSERERQRRAIVWGSIGLGIGVLFGVLRNEGLGYIVADGIDWMVLGVGVGLFIKQATRGAKIGALVGAGIGLLVNLLPNSTIVFGPLSMPTGTLPGLLLGILFGTFWGMIIGAWISMSSGSGPEQQGNHDVASLTAKSANANGG